MTAGFTAVRQPQARGIVQIHSTPAALCPHLEWALAGVLGAAPVVEWTTQPAEAGARRTELSWAGRAGTGAQLASKLAAFERVRFEVTEDAAAGSEGRRFCYTPTLGAFSAATGQHGDIVVGEDRLKHAMAQEAMGGEPLGQALERLLGVPWDVELDVFRYATEQAPVRWLHQVV